MTPEELLAAFEAVEARRHAEWLDSLQSVECNGGSETGDDEKAPGTSM